MLERSRAAVLAFAACGSLLPALGAGSAAAGVEAVRGAVDDVLAVAAARPDVPEAVVAGVMLSPMADRGRPLPAAGPEPADAARAKAAVEKLLALTKSPDRSLASRAWHGAALLRFGIVRDPEAARASARHAVETDPAADRSWILGAGLLREGERWEDLCSWCEKWNAARDAPLARGTWAHAEWMRGDNAAAERRWRALLGDGPEDFRARLGIASCLLARGGAAALDEAEKMLTTAREKHPDAVSADRDAWSCWMEHSAVLAYLRGDREAAGSTARRILDAVPSSETAKAVLKSLGK
jgi:tetratricopeptide (TPR) repeat protein